jgi:hypothetical protein
MDSLFHYVHLFHRYPLAEGFDADAGHKNPCLLKDSKKILTHENAKCKSYFSSLSDFPPISFRLWQPNETSRRQ